MLAVAAIGGWFPAKLTGYRWIAGHLGRVCSRRQPRQGERVRSDRDPAGMFAEKLGLLDLVMETIHDRHRLP